MRSQLVVVYGIVIAAVMVATATQSNIAGKWYGTATPSGGGTPTSWTVTLEQDGTQVTGSYVDATGTTGEVTGTLSENQGDFVIQFSDIAAITASFVFDDDQWTMCTYSVNSQPSTVLDSLDEDSNGKISASEAPDEMKQGFAFIDSNGDGGIDLEELTTILEFLASQTGSAENGTCAATRTQPAVPVEPPAS